MDPHGGLLRLGGEPPLEAVLFDAGLTLIQTATPAVQVAAGVLAAHGVPFTPEELDEAMDRAEALVASRWHLGDWWAADRTVRDLFASAYRHGLTAVRAVGPDPELAARLAEAIYDDYQETRHWSLYPDVRPTLAALRHAGLRLGIISDWGHGLEAIVLELGLHAYVEFVVVSARVGIAKPNPRLFDLALGRIGVRPERAVFVGDTYVTDVLGARSAGVTPVLLDRSADGPAVDCVTIRSLEALPPLLGVPSGL